MIIIPVPPHALLSPLWTTQPAQLNLTKVDAIYAWAFESKSLNKITLHLSSNCDKSWDILILLITFLYKGNLKLGAIGLGLHHLQVDNDLL